MVSSARTCLILKSILIHFVNKLVIDNNDDGDSFSFMLQVWNRLSGDSLDPNKVNFESFVKTIAWWQQTTVADKLKCKL